MEIGRSIAISIVFDLTATEGQSSVFGSNDAVRKQASPLFHIRPGAPPFLVTYCQWDYATLPAQARGFHRALTNASVTAELAYIPERNHISEMLHLPEDGDPTANAVLQFIRRVFP